MSQFIYQRTIEEDNEALAVQVRQDGRLRKYVRWSMRNGVVEVRVPRLMGRREAKRVVEEEIVPKILRQRRRARRKNDADLEARARRINRACFGAEIAWHTIRWVSNMTKRLGSATTGGTTDGDIRISDRVKHWPDYVIDYIVAHELAHRRHPDHSKAFWAYLAQYPHTERARGFIEGIAYAGGSDPDALL